MLPILITTERACAELAASASISRSLDCTVYTGLDGEEKEAPAIICSSTNAQEDFPFSGIWHVRTDITVKENAYDTSGSLGILSDAIFERFLTVDTGSLSTRVPNYSVIDVIADACDNSVEGDIWKQTLSLDVICSLK